MSLNTFKTLLVASLFEGAAGLAWLMFNPSKAVNARWLGYSFQRLGLAAVVMIVLVLLGWAIWHSRKIHRRVDLFLRQGDHLFFTQVTLSAGSILAWVAFIFSWLFVPPNLRPILAWTGLVCLQCFLALATGMHDVYLQKDFNRRYSLPPPWPSLEPAQKKVLAVLLGLSLIYFCLFIPLNLSGANNEHTFSLEGGDEYIIYPFVTTMFQPGATFSGTLYNIFIYEEYHYGYPFFALSALVLLPVRLVAGPQFIHMTQVNLLILRQLVSVLPIILSALILVYLATRFRSRIKSAALLVLILTLPGVVQYNHNFWHPDALNLLFIVITFFYLDQDRLRFGRNFYLAAIACGLSAATRLYGFFFFLAIAGYLAAGWIKHVLRLRQLAGRAAVFALVMVATILLSNPFLFDSGARANLVRIMRDKNVELSSGYNDPDPEQVYRTGWDAWLPYFEQSYASNFFSVFLLVSAAAGAAAGKPPDRPQRVFNAILLAWVLVVTGYLVYFVGVKSTHYMLPLFVPLYAAAFSLPSALEGARYPPFVRKAAWGLVIIFFLAQLATQLVKIPNALN